MTATVGRFVVRDMHPWEGAKVFALTGDVRVMRYMGFAVHKTVDEATALIETYKNSPSKFQAVCQVDTPADILGIVGFEVRGHQATMTVMFRGDMKARGAGREFSVPFAQWVFTHPSIWRLSAFCHVDNLPVQRVLERMGAHREGQLRKFAFFPNVHATEPQDVYLYSIVRN
jgi:RimJ/RimL family protein N-acetyltransferase